MQFAISTCLIILTLLIFKQLNHLQSISLGFNQENLLVIRNIDALGPNKIAFKEDLKNSNYVINASVSNMVPPEVNYSDIFKPANGEDRDYGFNYYFVDYDHFKTFEIPLKSGRYFSEAHPSDSNAVLINEAAAKIIGWENPVGEKIQTHWKEGDNREIIGVVKDFNFLSLKDEVTPLVIFPGFQGTLLTVKLSQGDVNQKIKFIKSKWQSLAASTPFDFSFIDADFNAKFNKEKQLGKIFMVFTFFSILVAGLGLIGLATFSSQQRSKEIGIRKVLGSSSLVIIGLLSKEYLKLIGISFLLAVPLSILVINWWLKNFAYKTELGVTSFIIGGVFTLVLALVSVSYQSLKAALSNPVNSIRNE